jgi:hypothetical protein
MYSSFFSLFAGYFENTTPRMTNKRKEEREEKE